jgi:hypothetical protein
MRLIRQTEEVSMTPRHPFVSDAVSSFITRSIFASPADNDDAPASAPTILAAATRAGEDDEGDHPSFPTALPAPPAMPLLSLFELAQQQQQQQQQHLPDGRIARILPFGSPYAGSAAGGRPPTPRKSTKLRIVRAMPSHPPSFPPPPFRVAA